MSDRLQQKNLSRGIELPLMEEFYTIQGEGFHTGKAAYFIRIGGCDVGCHWCDVKESWNPNIHPVTPIDRIIENANKYSKTVVVTGGEPLMWDLEPLTKGLKAYKIDTHIETSGAFELSGVWDWICLSPKKLKPVKTSVLLKADELKVIVYNNSDFKFAEEHAKKVSENCKLYLQPEWSKHDEITPKIINFILQNPKWNISLQTHKFMKIP